MPIEAFGALAIIILLIALCVSAVCGLRQRRKTRAMWKRIAEQRGLNL